jgi:hypothetical protein
MDLSANLFSDKFTIGAATESAAVSALVVDQATDSWFIGYGYNDLENDPD